LVDEQGFYSLAFTARVDVLALFLQGKINRDVNNASLPILARFLLI
jgi:hypothetical protein